jgi:Rrf2 family iron-sulfur cluster assembly transcriptional regulator
MKRLKQFSAKKILKKDAMVKLQNAYHTHDLWDELETHINSFFENKSLEDLN